MQLADVSEEVARTVVVKCMDVNKHPPAFCKYVSARYSDMISCSSKRGTGINYHKLLTELTEGCGWHSYLIINRVVKTEVFW